MRFILLLLLSLDAHAYRATPESSCTPIDLRGQFPLKMRHQGEMGWCYAHAAADYLQFTYRIDDQISAADIAIHYSRSKWSRLVTFFRNTFNPDLRDEPAQTGLILYAVRMALAQGYCPESSLPSDEWTRIATDGTISKVEILQATLELFELQKHIHAESLTSAAELPWRFDFKNISAQEFYDLLATTSRQQLLTRLRSAACDPDRRPYPKTSAPMSFRLRNGRVFERMNWKLETGAPLAVDFFSDVLKNYDHPKRKIDNLHTVLTVGRRFDPAAGECSYLLKNSYGDQCRDYDPKIQCEGGYVWLPASKLFRALTSTFTMSQ